MHIKPGNQTTEYKLTAVTNLVNAGLALFVVYGLMSQEQSALWAVFIFSLLAVIVPVAAAIMTREYTRSRTALKLAAMKPGASSHRPEAAE